MKKALAASQDTEYRQMVEYVALKTIAGYLYVFSKKGTRQNLKMICDFAERMLDTYFPDMYKNPFIRFRKPAGLPFKHRAAVVILKVTYRLHLLYPFALLYTGVR